MLALKEVIRSVSQRGGTRLDLDELPVVPFLSLIPLFYLPAVCDMRRLLCPWPLWILVALALALRVGAAVVVENRVPEAQRFIFGDSDSYWRLGQAIASGAPYEIGDPASRVFRTPGYPVLLAAMFHFTGPDTPVLWGRFLSAVLSSLAVVGIYWLGDRLFDKKVGLLAAAVVAIYPGAVALGTLNLSEAPFCALLPLQIVCWHQGWNAPTRSKQFGWLFAAGLFSGLTTLVRPSWLLFAPFAIIVGLLLAKDRKQQLLSAGPVLLGVCIVMLPWWVRNHQVVGRFVPTTLQVGASLYDGLNEQATGASNMDFVATMTAAEQERGRQHGLADETLEWRLNQRMLRASLAWAADHPRKVLELAGTKFVRIWNVWPNDPQFRATPIRLAVASTYVPLLTIAAISTFLYWHSGFPYLLCFLPAVYITLLHIVFVSSIRYRVPAMIVLSVPAAALVMESSRRLMARGRNLPEP